MDLILHHVGIVTRNIEEAAASYVKSIGYERATEIIHDPVQTAYVQFLRLPGQAVYLELVSPDGPKSKLTRAAEKGGGLNHLCYSTMDIETECDRMRTSGFLLISRPTSAVAFGGRRIAWLMGKEGALFELVERGPEGSL